MSAQTFEGLPCPYGHTLRYARAGTPCVECQRERRRREHAARDGVPAEFALDAQKRRQAMALRLAERRAAMTSRQRMCAYGVSI